MELPLGLNLGLLTFQLLNFIVITVILYGLAYKPVVNMLEKRKATIAQSLEDARIAQEARANAEAEAENIKKAARDEAARKSAEAIAAAERAAGEIRAAAEVERGKIIAQAEIDAAAAREQALAEVRDQIAALAISAANKIVSENLDQKRQQALVDEFFSGIKAGKITVLEGEALSGSSAEVVSALPLTDSQKKIASDELVGMLGAGAAIAYRVDPNILGGLIIRVGDKVIDGSARGRLEALRQRLS